MPKAIDQFRVNIQHVRNLGVIYNSVLSTIPPGIDATDILRAQHVLAVSALDHFVHEITRMGMLDVFTGVRPHTPAYLKFKMSLICLVNSPTPAELEANFDNDIRIQNGLLTFQSPDKIADAIRLFCIKAIWEEISSLLGIPVKDLKEQLNLIVQRRNKIAHEADMDPSFPNTRWPMKPTDVSDSITFIENICEAIDLIVN